MARITLPSMRIRLPVIVAGFPHCHYIDRP